MESQELFYRAPSILLTANQAKALRVENSRKLDLSNEQVDIGSQLNQRPGVLRPGSGLRTSQESIPKPPSILLNSVENKPNSKPVGVHNKRKTEMKLHYNNFILVTNGVE